MHRFTCVFILCYLVILSLLINALCLKRVIYLFFLHYVEVAREVILSLLTILSSHSLPTNKKQQKRKRRCINDQVVITLSKLKPLLKFSTLFLINGIFFFSQVLSKLCCQPITVYIPEREVLIFNFFLTKQLMSVLLSV